MKFDPCAALLAFACLALPSQAATAGIASGDASRMPTPAEDLRARFDPCLELLRAGRVDVSAPLTADDRAVLRAAQDRSPELAEMRAGSEESVLLIVVIVLLLLLLI